MSDHEDDPRLRWHRWKEAALGRGHELWHEGLDVSRVTRLRGAARQEALDMLGLGVDLGDSHAAQALAAMGVPEAVPRLERALASVGALATSDERHLRVGTAPSPRSERPDSRG
ncbi:MAG: hypothetical protein KC501_12765 [Myxococcales bacterium]|nr:hypothetical protein [Myxococcales bacterium]